MLRNFRRHPQLWIFLVALAARVLWVVTLPNALNWPDEREFMAIAVRLADGAGYHSNSYRANPILPAYLAAFLGVFGRHYLLPRLGQAVIGAFTCVILGRLAGLLVGSAAGWFAGLALAVYPPHIYLAGTFYVDCIATFFATLAAYLVALLPGLRRGVAAAAACGVVLGLAALTRATFLMMVPLAAVAVIYAMPEQRGRAAGYACVIALATTLTIAPWSVRNRHVFGTPVMVSSGLWETIWKGNNELADGGPDDRNAALGGVDWRRRLAQAPPDLRSRLEAKYEPVQQAIQRRARDVHDAYIARDEVLRSVVIDYVRDHPGRAAALFARKVLTMLDAFSDTATANSDTTSAKKLLAAVAFYPMLALALVGAVLALPERRKFAFPYLLIVAWLGAHGVMTACTRFRLPIDPLFLLFASVTVEHVRFRLAMRSSLAAADRAISAPAEAAIRHSNMGGER